MTSYYEQKNGGIHIELIRQIIQLALQTDECQYSRRTV